MRKIGRFIGKICLWILTVFLGTATIVYLPRISGLITLFLTLLVIPIDKLQNVVSRYIKAWMKALIVPILFILAVCILPPSDNSLELSTQSESIATETVAYTEVIQLATEAESMGFTESNNETWRDGFPTELVKELEQAFIEIGEKPECIETIEVVDLVDTGIFVRRDYKVTFERGTLSGILDPETWVHSRFYRITTQNWADNEPEKQLYPNEYLVAIKFWSDDDSTNVNQWAQNGTGKLQNSEISPTTVASGDEIHVAYCIDVVELVKEINTDHVSAGEKYNGQWIEITGIITCISESADLTGYYLWGEKGKEGLKITCWVNDNEDLGLNVGNEVTFVGILREISTVNHTEIGLCTIK